MDDARRWQEMPMGVHASWDFPSENWHQNSSGGGGAVDADDADEESSISSSSSSSSGGDRDHRHAAQFKPTWNDQIANAGAEGLLDSKHSQLLFSSYKWASAYENASARTQKWFALPRPDFYDNSAAAFHERGKFLYDQFVGTTQFMHEIDASSATMETWCGAQNFATSGAEAWRQSHLVFGSCHIVSAQISECVTRDISVKNKSTLRVLQRLAHTQRSWIRLSVAQEAQLGLPSSSSASSAASRGHPVVLDVPEHYYACEPLFVILFDAGHYSVLVTVDGLKWFHYDSLRSQTHAAFADRFLQSLNSARRRYSAAASRSKRKEITDSLPKAWRPCANGQQARSCLSIVKEQMRMRKDPVAGPLMVPCQTAFQTDGVSCLLFVHAYIDYFMYTRGAYYPVIHETHIARVGHTVASMRAFVVAAHIYISDYERRLDSPHADNKNKV